mgnify:CR=1 FL=1
MRSKILYTVVFSIFFYGVLYYGMGREIERRKQDFVCDGDYCAHSWQEIDAMHEAAKSPSFQVGKTRYAQSLQELQ